MRNSFEDQWARQNLTAEEVFQRTRRERARCRAQISFQVTGRLRHASRLQRRTHARGREHRCGSHPLDRYALGQAEHQDNFCRWMEFRSPDVGSIRGGSAHKHLIYFQAKVNEWWFDTKLYTSVEEAWAAVRSGSSRRSDTERPESSSGSTGSRPFARARRSSRRLCPSTSRATSCRSSRKRICVISCANSANRARTTERWAPSR